MWMNEGSFLVSRYTHSTTKTEISAPTTKDNDVLVFFLIWFLFQHKSQCDCFIITCSMCHKKISNLISLTQFAALLCCAVLSPKKSRIYKRENNLFIASTWKNSLKAYNFYQNTRMIIKYFRDWQLVHAETLLLVFALVSKN
jgi:hypothetical protein